MGNWRGDLENWLAPLVAALGDKTWGRLCPAHVAGVIGPGDRKSVQPMATRDRVVSCTGFVRLPGPQRYDPLSRFSGGRIRGMVGPRAERVRLGMTV